MRERRMRSIPESGLKEAEVRKPIGQRWVDPATGKSYTKYDANFVGAIDPHDISEPLVDSNSSSNGSSTRPKFSKDAKP